MTPLEPPDGDDGTEIRIDLDGEMHVVIPKAHPQEEDVEIESVSPDEPFAPKE